MYLISEVAELHSITKKTLLHYERIGLFMPCKVDPQTGYRYYSYEQFPFLKQIIYLKDLGLSLEEIQELFKDRRFEPLIDKLKTRKEEVLDELKELNRVNLDLDYLIDHYTKIKHLDERDLYKPGIKLLKEHIVIYELCEGEANEKCVMMAYRNMLRKLLSLDKLTQMPYGTISLKTAKLYQDVGSFISIPYSFGLENELVLPEGKYAYMYKKGGYYDKESVEILVKWIKEQGYELVGDILDYSLVDYTFTNSSEEMIQELQIQIK